jgi:hypothetical protein
LEISIALGGNDYVHAAAVLVQRIESMFNDRNNLKNQITCSLLSFVEENPSAQDAISNVLQVLDEFPSSLWQGQCWRLACLVGTYHPIRNARENV